MISHGRNRFFNLRELLWISAGPEISPAEARCSERRIPKMDRRLMLTHRTQTLGQSAVPS